MANKMKLIRNFNRESRRFRFVVVVAGFVLLSITFFALSQPQAFPSLILDSKRSVHAVPNTPKTPETIHSQQLGQEKTTEQGKLELGTNNETQEKSINSDELKANQDELDGELRVLTTLDDPSVELVQKESPNTTDKLGTNNETQEKSANSDDLKANQNGLDGELSVMTTLDDPSVESVQKETPSTTNKLGSDIHMRERSSNNDESNSNRGNIIETKEGSTACDDPNSVQCEKNGEVRLQENSNPAVVDPTQGETWSNSKQLGVGGQNMNSEKKPFCDFSHYRVDQCEMYGDIRIHRNPSSAISVESTERNESYRIRPYPRKGDKFALSHVTEVIVRSSTQGPQCSITHQVPAIIFSVGGYTGNLFHDFTDVMLPIFLTANQFNGEVQLVISEARPWWMSKYLSVFQKLSRYEIIDFDNDNRVHCFKRVIVGLRAQMEFTIDPSLDPNGYSMADFARFMRSAYSLKRDTMTKIEEYPHRKPRLLIVSRQRSRRLTNTNEVVELAMDLGYEVAVEEADVGTNVARFAEVINSFDVLMGVHGAGLTNLVFLPMNATIIQIVPWGGLEGIAMFDFGNGAKAMKLNYVQYSISVEESSLTEIYPRDHPVFRDPIAFHKEGWDRLKETFMNKQNVKLDIKRFRKVLWGALEHMMQ